MQSERLYLTDSHFEYKEAIWTGLNNSKVLLIGIDKYHANLGNNENYQKISNLNGAVKDILVFKDFLIQKRITENVFVLAGDEKRKKITANSGALRLPQNTDLRSFLCETREIFISKNMLELVLIRFLELVKENELAVVVFCGHGLVGENSLGNRGPEPYLLAQDSNLQDLGNTALTFERFLNIFNFEGKAKNRLLIVDACKSGMAHKKNKVSLNDLLKERIYSVYTLNFYNRIIISSADGFQVSHETKEGGYFLQAFIRGLKGFANPSINNYSATVAEVFDYAAKETILRSKADQTPIITGKKINNNLVSLPKIKDRFECQGIFKLISPQQRTFRRYQKVVIELELLDKEIGDQWQAFHKKELQNIMLKQSKIRVKIKIKEHKTGHIYETDLRNSGNDYIYKTTIDGLSTQGTFDFWFEIIPSLTNENLIDLRSCEWQFSVRL